MNFQDRTQGVGVPCVLLPSWPPPPSPRSLGAGVTVSVCGSPWLDIGLLFPS